MIDDIDLTQPFQGIGADMIAEAAIGVMADPHRGALAGLIPLFSRALKLAQRETSWQQARAAVMWAHAAESAGQAAESLIDRAESDPDRLHLAVSAAAGAATARYPARIVALGRALAGGLLAESETKLDLEQQVIDALSVLERPHLETLVVLEHGDDGVRAALIDGVGLGTLHDRMGYGVAFSRIMSALESGGLATSDPRLFDPAAIASVGSAEHWRPTEFGREVLSRLREAGLQSEQD